jgi:hypothetical protein
MEYFKCANCGSNIGLNIVAVYGTISKDQFLEINSLDDFNEKIQNLETIQHQLEPGHINDTSCTEPSLSDEDLELCKNIMKKLPEAE